MIFLDRIRLRALIVFIFAHDMQIQVAHALCIQGCRLISYTANIRLVTIATCYNCPRSPLRINNVPKQCVRFLYTYNLNSEDNWVGPDSRQVPGFHVIRRSNQSWAGLSSDLVIETTLMRSLKTTGGMTHGSGMSERHIALWTMSRPITSQYNEAMQEFTNLSHTTTEQRKESTEAKKKRDAVDLEEINSKRGAWSPFSPDPSLRNVVTGVVAEEAVNVHEYESVGC